MLQLRVVQTISLNTGTYRMGENYFKGSLVLSLHILVGAETRQTTRAVAAYKVKLAPMERLQLSPGLARA